MKKVFLALAAMFLAFSVNAQAPAGAPAAPQAGQGRQGGGQRGTPEEQVTRLGETITGISAEQKAKLVVIYTDAAAKRTVELDKLTAAAAGAQVDRAARTKVTDAINAERDVKMNAVFNDAQKAQYKKYLEERAASTAARGTGQGGPGAGGPPPAN